MTNINSRLINAKINAADEFYTQTEDIHNELSHYKDHFVGKVVYCNCDPEWSNFWKYFKDNFNEYGLKAVIATGYNSEGSGVVLSYDGNEVRQGKLNGNGSFDSPECLEILDGCDIVCTNPPFSLFTKFITTVVEHGKQLLVIGNQNAMTNPAIFKLFKENKLWCGWGFKGDAAHFINKHYDDYATAGDHKEGMIRVAGVVWFTNMRTDKQNEKLELTKSYNEDDYRKYDDYDAINVDKLSDIPNDYYGPVGVPITFLKKYNPEQFEVLGMDRDFTDNGRKGRFKMDGQSKYARVIIRRKKEDNPYTQTFQNLMERWKKI